ncbi:MAG: TonB-dependent receptor [Gemmatimonadetes bacterium]|nr:TonB-dependent receptor [Gemmatimonadota bacterium]
MTLCCACAGALRAGVLSAQTPEPDSSRAPQALSVGRSDSVIVTVTRVAQSIESLTGSADLRDRSELYLLGALTLDDALRELPGVGVTGSGRLGQEVRIETRGVTSGFGTQRTLVLLDGRPLTDEYLGTVDLAQFPLAGIARVELARGPASAVYGTNAMGGVVNLIPRRGSAIPISEITGEGGTFGSGSGSISHGRTAGPVDLFVDVSGLRTHGYLRNSRGEPIDWGTRRALANVGYEGHRLSARIYGSYFRGRGTEEDFDRDLRRDSQDLVLSYRALARRPEVLGESPGRGAGESHLRIYRSAFDQDLDWSSRPSQKFDQQAVGAILTHSRRLSRHLVTGGMEWRRETAAVREPGADEAPGAGLDRHVAVTSAFLQDDIGLGARSGIVLGLRFDGHPAGSELSYRMGVNHRLSPATTVRASAGRAFRAPTISDRFLPPTSSFGVVFEGNPTLEPEVLLSADAGMSQRLGTGASVDFAAFASRARDFYDFILQEDGVFRPQNIARVNIRGLEGRMRVLVGGGVGAEAAYTFTDARYSRFPAATEAEGRRLDDNVRHRGAFAATWRHAEGHAARLDVRVEGDRFTDPENSAEGRLPSHLLVDLATQLAVLPGVVATLHVENIFDRSYRTRPEFVQPGRSIRGGARLSF